MLVLCCSGHITCTEEPPQPWTTAATGLSPGHARVQRTHSSPPPSWALLSWAHPQTTLVCQCCPVWGAPVGDISLHRGDQRVRVLLAAVAAPLPMGLAHLPTAAEHAVSHHPAPVLHATGDGWQAGEAAREASSHRSSALPAR